MRKTLALATTAIITLALAACGTTGGIEDKSPENPDCTDLGGGIHQCMVTMSDTRRVTCLVYTGYRRGGMDCDWSHVDGADNL